jgi:xanthine dehydrogenase accessory factor
VRDVIDDLTRWWAAGDTVGIGTVVGTWKSSPRQPGAAMLVGPDGTAVGSVSGGCVEGAVYALAETARDDGAPVLQRYGVSDDDAFAVGLTCGGIIDVFVEQVNRETFPQLGQIAADIEHGRPVAVATVISGDPDLVGRRLVIGPDTVDGSLGSDRLDDAVRDDARGLLVQGTTATMHYGAHGERRLDDFAAAVARVGSFLGYYVTVCDARETFATTKRFPDADEVVVEWPHRYLERTEVDERTVLCVLTHDPKFDVPLLEIALRTPVAYIGAMGSRRTHDDRVKRLRELGLTEDELARLHAPIGLDVGARTPEETAVSIAAEIVAARWGGSGAQLRATEGPIHRNSGSPAA